MYTTIREKITRDFRELKMWVTHIDDVSDFSDYSCVSRGLFFVYAYGIFEEVVRQTVATTISEINNAKLTIGQCIFPIYSIALSRRYDSLYNVGAEHKWEKRWDISDEFSNDSRVEIPFELFPTDGKNIRIRQLNSIGKSFGVNVPVIPSPEDGQYIEEMVTNRNDIAHGNKSPKEIGRGVTKADLLLRCNKISEICSYVVDVYEQYILEQKYLRKPK